MLFSQTWYTNWIGLVKSNRLSNLFRDDVANGQANDLGESTLSQRVTPFAPPFQLFPPMEGVPIYRVCQSGK